MLLPFRTIDDARALAALGEAAGWPEAAPADGSVVVLAAERDQKYDGYTECYRFRVPAEVVDRIRGPIERGRGRRTSGLAELGRLPGWFEPAKSEDVDLFVVGAAGHGGSDYFAFSRTESVIYLLRWSM